MYEMNEAGRRRDDRLLEAAERREPDAADEVSLRRRPHLFRARSCVYNPKLIPDAPKSFDDTLDPKHGDKLGIIDIQYQYVMVAAALAAGGKVSNFEPGKALLLAAKKAGARIYPTNEAFAQALKTEEIGIGIMWKARAVQWQNAGISVETVAPERRRADVRLGLRRSRRTRRTRTAPTPT